MLHSSIQIALFQPDIAQNTGTIMRLCAAWNLTIHIIEPTGFNMNDTRFRRAVMDYITFVNIVKHLSFPHFLSYIQAHNNRLIVLSTQSKTPYTHFSFSSNDILIFGRETAGLTQDVFKAAYECLRIPMNPQARSLNVALSCAIVTSEAMKQLGHLNEITL